jgi:ATP-dependent Clp protease ATP-binding subunit ClpC
MDCEHVGSDHLLLGVLVNGEGFGATVLSSAGLSVETGPARITAIGCTTELAPNGYGSSMRNILRLSSHHADALRHAEIEPEHFVLGLLDEADGPALRIFRHFGLDVDRIRTTLLQKLSDKSP